MPIVVPGATDLSAVLTALNTVIDINQLTGVSRSFNMNTAVATATLIQNPLGVLANRKLLGLFNNNAVGGAVIYLGGAGVTNADGKPLVAQASPIWLASSPTHTIYYYSVAGGDDLRVIEMA